jgi:hypothetical protein
LAWSSKSPNTCKTTKNRLYPNIVVDGFGEDEVSMEIKHRSIKSFLEEEEEKIQIPVKQNHLLNVGSEFDSKSFLSAQKPSRTRFNYQLYENQKSRSPCGFNSGVSEKTNTARRYYASPKVLPNSAGSKNRRRMRDMILQGATGASKSVDSDSNSYVESDITQSPYDKKCECKTNVKRKRENFEI